MTISTIAGLVGGLGLFLLGMRLMTNGLRKAAGTALKTILSQWTNTPAKGIASGFCFTALVQSSSAVTIAAIGFVNAGLMTLNQSIGVIFGSNIGTTVTGWLVTLVGFDIKIKALALPLIGIGAILRLSGNQTRRASFGDALTGFGLFFLGIEVLKDSFNAVQPMIDLGTISNEGILSVLLFLVIGFMLTLIMQSSSAAMALVLTAAASGITTPLCAAAAVIGTNVGTTSTAAISVIGATNNAKKVAAAHIIFNLGTGIMALVLLPVLLWIIQTVQHAVSDQPSITMTLALFHTIFNILGVCLFTPFIQQLTNLLNRKVGTHAPETSVPKYLDMNIASTPVLAVEALYLELGRLGEQTRAMAQHVLASSCRYSSLLKELTAVEGLIAAIRAYAINVQKMDLQLPTAEGLPRMLRVIQYYSTVLEIIHRTSREHPTLNHIIPGQVDDFVYEFKTQAKDMLNVAHTPCSEEFESLEHLLGKLQDKYQELKSALLEAGANGTLEIDHMAELLEYYSSIRRMVEQAIKGSIYWAETRDISETCRHEAEQDNFTWKPLEATEKS
ncbi:Na/Pi cotransporter family protein [Pseudodesulfovibrio senegalensis]|uniref:Na/Pi cotransporter family protein n=1 Tax=Pseudodesulfovibrio senegalensis TaxID=1721087 RepID=A0A6N6N6L7_9BACT|nr:Na/Pi symporter [Pseudodesulfovibrio senegalensis]KAB1443676.1 Na/Pi cotransporter family protein [Pseudodesulfovibrio senegalensis]